MKKQFERIWKDPVWSTVISTAIIALFVYVGGIVLSLWSASAAPSFIGSLLSSKVPVWVLFIVLFPILALLLVFYQQRRPKVETIRVVQDMRSSCWGLAAVEGAPAMQIVFDAHVTDISGKPNRILRAEIAKPLTHAHMASISTNHDARRPQVLNPYETAELRALFFLKPVVGVNTKPWRATIVLIDQYGNRHAIKDCVFKAMVNQPQELAI